MEVSKEVGEAIDGLYRAIEKLCDVLSEENGFKDQMAVFGSLCVVVNIALHKLIEQAWGGKPNKRNCEEEMEK